MTANRFLSLLSVLGFLVSLLAVGCASEGEEWRLPDTHVTYLDTSYYGASAASLEERIYAAEIVVRATLDSSADGVLTFSAAEYLKGTGPNRFILREGGERRNTNWDNREALLFLSGPLETSPSTGDSQSRSTSSQSPLYAFADTTTWADGAYSYQGSLPQGNTIDSRNPVWLPSTTTSGAGHSNSATRASTGGDPDPSFIIESESPYGESNPTITLSELKDLIGWIGTGDGNEGYERCIREAIRVERKGRDVAAYYGEPWTPSTVSVSLPSQAPAGTALDEYGGGEHSAYNRRFLAGPDAELFAVRLVDSDDDPSNGYSFSFENTRPLPSGSYTFKSYVQSHFYIPCDYKDSPIVGLIWNVKVEAPPAKTVLEAFFDPISSGDAVGYFGAGDALKPTSFSIDDVSTTIWSLKWQDGAVTLELSPYNAVEWHALDFIALDGTTSLSLKTSAAMGDSTAGTLTWVVASQPWSSGDELMLRLRQSSVAE